MATVDYRDCWNFFDKVFCISVDQRQDRRKTAKKEFAGVGLLDRLEFVIVEKHPQNPEQGIYESHLLCMEKGLAAGAETILIFEDDIQFHGFNEETLRSACSRLSNEPGWNGLFLGCIVSGIQRTDISSLVQIEYTCLTHAYAVSRDFANHLLSVPWQGIPYDGQLKLENDRFFSIHPMSAFQSDSPTDNRTLQIDRIRRLLGGLQHIQRLNELFYSHKKAIIVGHVLVAILTIAVAWFLK